MHVEVLISDMVIICMVLPFFRIIKLNDVIKLMGGGFLMC